MRTRSFIGLIFLIVALIVVSTPALLEPAADAVEELSISSGLRQDPGTELKRQRAIDAAQNNDPVTSLMQLKGYQQIENGDMLDTTDPTRRIFDQHGRLEAGDARALLPNQQARSDAFSAPEVLNDKGALLDRTGCPVLGSDAEVRMIMDDKDKLQRTLDKAASSTDSDSCDTAIRQRMLTLLNPTSTLPGDQRTTAASITGDSTVLLFEQRKQAMYDAFFGDSDTAALADEAKAMLRGSN